MKIIVIGGSAGSIRSLKKITSNLSTDMDAAIFVVIHVPPDKTSSLPTIINQDCPLPASHAENNQIIEPGNIYVAVPDHHMLIEKGKICLGKGPKENRFRPSIDVLFRSASLEYSSQVAGIILSGLLDDGTAGLNAIKKRKGIAIVQDPDDAEFPGMPLSALHQVKVDHCVPAADIAPLLGKLLKNHKKEKIMKKDSSLEWENEIARGINTSFDNIEKFATSTRYICPECEGPLFRIKDKNITHYRCFIGHAYTSETLLDDISEKVEHLLWTTYRTMDEKREMISNHPHLTDDLEKEKEKLLAQLETIKKMLR